MTDIYAGKNARIVELERELGHAAGRRARIAELEEANTALDHCVDECRARIAELEERLKESEMSEAELASRHFSEEDEPIARRFVADMLAEAHADNARLCVEVAKLKIDFNESVEQQWNIHKHYGGLLSALRARIVELEGDIRTGIETVEHLHADIAEARAILAWTDIGSLPFDWTLRQAAQTRMGDVNNLRAEVERLKTKSDADDKLLADAVDDYDRMDAEVERLEAALREAVGLLADHRDIGKTLAILDAALSGKGET